jgi:hypothetical protein
MPAQQTPQEEALQVTQNWLNAISKGDRTALNAIMDSRCIFTTPAGDVLTRDRLVPDDPAQAVQQLPAMNIENPIARIYGDTSVLMGRLKSQADPKQILNGTFVFSKKDGAWKLVAVHLSAQK